MVRLLPFEPIGTLSAGLRTDFTARSKHARVETGRNIPGILARIFMQHAEYTQLNDIVLHTMNKYEVHQKQKGLDLL